MLTVSVQNAALSAVGCTETTMPAPARRIAVVTEARSGSNDPNRPTRGAMITVYGTYGPGEVAESDD